jgi:glycosyltransferase involved in cell wall biosynthesis
MLAIQTEPNLAAAIAWRLARLPGRLAISEQNSLTGAAPLRMAFIKRLYPLADVVVSISRVMKSQMIEAGLSSDRVTVIHNPLPPELTDDPLPSRARVKPPIIVGIGRLAPQKDFATLIRAFDVLRRERECTLVILGEGPERPELEALVSALGLDDQIKMPGFTNPPWEVLGEASVLAMSSRWEGWPGVLVEAFALGVPVVSTDCPTGPREILDDGKYGHLVPVGNVVQLARAIGETLDTPPPPGTLRERSRLWRLDLVLDQYLDAMGMSAR